VQQAVIVLDTNVLIGLATGRHARAADLGRDADRIGRTPLYLPESVLIETYHVVRSRVGRAAGLRALQTLSIRWLDAADVRSAWPDLLEGM